GGSGSVTDFRRRRRPRPEWRLLTCCLYSPVEVFEISLAVVFTFFRPYFCSLNVYTHEEYMPALSGFFDGVSLSGAISEVSILKAGDPWSSCKELPPFESRRG